MQHAEQMWLEGFTKAANAAGVTSAEDVAELMQRTRQLELYKSQPEKYAEAYDAVMAKSAGIAGLLGKGLMLGAGALGLGAAYRSGRSMIDPVYADQLSLDKDTKQYDMQSRRAAIAAQRRQMQEDARLLTMSPAQRKMHERQQRIASQNDQLTDFEDRAQHNQRMREMMKMYAPPQATAQNTWPGYGSRRRYDPPASY